MTTDFGRRLKMARSHAGLTQKQLAPKAGMSQSNLSELETVGHESGKTAQLAAALGVDAHWLATGEGNMLPAGHLNLAEPPARWMDSHPSISGALGTLPGVSLAQELRHPRTSNVPVVLTWSADLFGPLPSRFMLEVQDDSMTLLDPPSMRPGDFAIFAAADTAVPGTVVLVADGRQHVYIRKVQQRTPAHWLAVARNPAYQTLDSVGDMLRILAVQVGGLWE